MAFHNAHDGGQAQASAFVGIFRREEWVENPV